MDLHWVVTGLTLEWPLNLLSESCSVETLRSVPIVHLFPVSLRDGQGLTSDWRDINQCVPMNRQLVTIQF